MADCYTDGPVCQTKYPVLVPRRGDLFIATDCAELTHPGSGGMQIAPRSKRELFAEGYLTSTPVTSEKQAIHYGVDDFRQGGGYKQATSTESIGKIEFST